MYKKYLLACVLLFISKLAQAQVLSGILRSNEDYSPIEGAHIINTCQNKMTTSSALGKFTIQAAPGDTLVVSHINFNTKQFLVNRKNEVEIRMNAAEIPLNEVVVNNIPVTEQAFKKRLIEMEMQDNPNFIPFGIQPAKQKGKIPKLYDKKTELKFGSPATGPGIGLPVSFFTKKFSKRHKAERHYYETVASHPVAISTNKKYNRELVASLTGLKDNELTKFMHSLDLDSDYITNASEYEIAVLIIEKYKKYVD